MGGWSDKTKLKLNSTQVEVEVGVELGNSKNEPVHMAAKRYGQES